MVLNVADSIAFHCKTTSEVVFMSRSAHVQNFKQSPTFVRHFADERDDDFANCDEPKFLSRRRFARDCDRQWNSKNDGWKAMGKSAEFVARCKSMQWLVHLSTFTVQVTEEFQK